MSEDVTYIEKVKPIISKTGYNPFPGLRPFGIAESHLFFGREGQSDEVLDKLSKNRFVAVIGASGSGKSSLMYCGLTPILQGGFMAETSPNWRLIVTRPGGGPINNLAEAIVVSDTNNTKPLDDDVYFKKAITASILRSSSLGLVEAIQQNGISSEENILIMVDQFEELFRYKKSRGGSTAFNESLAFVKLLLEAVKQSTVPIYIILTMRSDFIGECSQFQELTSLINESHYLIPQMTRNDLYKAIVGPVAVAGGKITSRLVHQLLNDVGDNPDQLPILQHALMRTWEYWSKNRQSDEPVDVVHYEAIGRMQKALSEHANEAFDELDQSRKFICEKLFKALTEKGADNRGIRRPTTTGELAEIAGVSLNEMKEVIDKFRVGGRSFLSPAAPAFIGEETIIDISHESLMRIWDRLIVWVEEEATAVKMYLRLSEAAENYQTGKTGLWRPPDLHLAINWKETQKPTLPWAQRYNPAFERTIIFIDTSIKEYEAEEQNKLKLQKRALRRSKIFALVLGVAAILSLGFMLYALVAQVESRRNEGKAKIERTNANKQKYIADLTARIAEYEGKKAIESEGIAKLQQNKAFKQTLIAELNAIIAINESQNADFQRKSAEERKAEAEVNAEIAEAERGKATSARRRADTLRMLSIAQSMAVKSLQITRDTTQKVIVSYLSYLYNKDFKGPKHNADIYSALYFANKNIEEEDNTSRFSGHTSPVRAVAMIPKTESFISLGSDKKIFKWSRNSSVEKDSLINSVDDINRSIALCDNGKYLACGAQQQYIQIYNLESENKKPEKVFKAHTGAVIKMVFTNDNRYLLSVGSEGMIKIWDIKTDSITGKNLNQSTTRINSIALSPDNRMLAGAFENGSIIIWNFEDITSKINNTENKEIRLDYISRYQKEFTPIHSLDFNKDGTFLAAGDEKGAVHLFNLIFTDESISLGGQNARIIDVKFSHNDDLLAAASFDGSVQIWETKSFNTQPFVLRDNNSWVWSVSFTNDDKELIVGYKDGSIQIWPTDIELLAQKVKPAVSRNFSLKEWDRYVAKDIEPRKICNKPFDEDVQERIEKLRKEKKAKKEEREKKQKENEDFGIR